VHGVTARELRAIQRARWRALLAYLRANPPEVETTTPTQPIEEAPVRRGERPLLRFPANRYPNGPVIVTRVEPTRVTADPGNRRRELVDEAPADDDPDDAA
jgi:hypothetical protein